MTRGGTTRNKIWVEMVTFSFQLARSCYSKFLLFCDKELENEIGGR